ncbi:hypothetical protein BPO_0251 [Bergeyella porcorum]|uniref:Uncharacterized protein n=1 Tax=Bergeyella porcorum TaxID=1735111 RepID=A0AAU0EY20_9FLAO
MEGKLIEYILFQIILLLLIYIYLKDFIQLWKDKPDNSYGLSSSLGVILSSILASILLYFLIFIKNISIIDLLFKE